MKLENKFDLVLTVGWFGMAVCNILHLNLFLGICCTLLAMGYLLKYRYRDK